MASATRVDGIVAFANAGENLQPAATAAVEARPQGNADARPALAADRAEFAGMLLEEADFCDGRGWTEATKERLFDGGAAALARWRREAYAAYKAKFDPEAILRRAGVWSL